MQRKVLNSCELDMLFYKCKVTNVNIRTKIV